MSKPSFQTILAALGDETSAFPNRYLPLFSDLPPADVSALNKQWPGLAKKRKRTLLTKLVELYQSDTLLSFEALAASLLDDPDEQIRADALRLLAESENTHLLPQLVTLAEKDPAVVVQVQATQVLGRFVEMAELEEIPTEAGHLVEETLLRVARSENTELQRAAIEALGYSSRPEVETLIQHAFSLHDPKWVASALLAMGRSANAQWEEAVLAKLDDPHDDIRRAAVQAAGDLRLESARQFLFDLLEEEEDNATYVAGIWALSQIGGEEVRIVLQSLLDEAEDDDVIEFLEDAIDNLDLTDQMNSFDLLAIDPDDELDK